MKWLEYSFKGLEPPLKAQHYFLRYKKTNQRNWHNPFQWLRFAHRKITAYANIQDGIYKLFCMASTHIRHDSSLPLAVADMKLSFGTSIQR